MLNSSGPNVPMNQREDYQEAKRNKNVYIEHLAKLTTDFMPESKFQCDQTNHPLGTTKVRSASTQRQAGNGTTVSQQQALLFSGWQASAWWQSSSWSLTSKWCERYFFIFYKSRCFVCRQWRFPCKRRGGVNTTLKPTHKSHARTRDFFTRGSRLESSSQDSQCVSQNSHSHIEHSTCLPCCILHT